MPAHHQLCSRGDPMLSGTPRTFIGSTTFQVNGMNCAHCQRAVTEEIAGVAGVESVTVDLASGTVTVTADRPVDRADIAAAVDEAGYALIPCPALRPPPGPAPPRTPRRRPDHRPLASHHRCQGVRHDRRSRVPDPLPPTGASPRGAARAARALRAAVAPLAAPQPAWLRLTPRPRPTRLPPPRRPPHQESP